MIWVNERVTPLPVLRGREPIDDPEALPVAPVVDEPDSEGSAVVPRRQEVPAVDPRRQDAPEPVREPRRNPAAEPLPH